jgi:wyosine [tRNA(Phe)-imidazoG37] synthetase (radical SAM superfamily)
MKYIYGPVNSRRLGKSLGLSLTPYKVCNLDCLYCQLGRTTLLTNQRKEYINIDEIMQELKIWLEANKEELSDIRYITISGSGEPTLNIKVGQLISKIKEITNISVAVITNSTLLNDISLRKELLTADLIVPSLDAATEACFNKINRPHQDIKLEDIYSGLVSLRKEFKGKIWLEVMIVRGINDDLRHIKKIKLAINIINPDKIQINSPVRCALEQNVSPVERKKLEKIRDIFGDKAEIV